MSESELSSVPSELSSPPPTDDEMPEIKPLVKPKAKKGTPKKKGTMLSFVEQSPPRKRRADSPPHELVFEDNPDIAFIVMFRARFSEAFPPKTPTVGPQDIERGVLDEIPSSIVESLLCALLSLVLNRKKPVEKGHYGRALEEAIQTQKSQWPRAWNGQNPLHGGRSFNTMTATERLTLLRTLIMWSLHGSEAINTMIKEAYKQSRHEDDRNQPLSVQPWGRDGDKRRYFLIEGKDDTSFRVYREYISPGLQKSEWWSVAGSIDELRALAAKLNEEDGTQHARRLATQINNAIPRFEATEMKRKRREYRLNRKDNWTRPQPGFSLYEGRTRGKRMKYTFSDEEEEVSDALSLRRSNRHSGRETPAEAAGPTVTASGRQVRPRKAGGLYGETLLSGQSTERASPATGEYVRSDASEEPQPPHGRATRSRNETSNGWSSGRRRHIETYNSVDEMDDEDDASSSGGEWDGGDEEDEAHQMDVDDEEDDLDDGASEGDLEPKSLVVRLKVGKESTSPKAEPTFGTATSASQVPLAPAPVNHAVNVAPKQEPAPQANGITLPPISALPYQPPPQNMYQAPAAVPAPPPVPAPQQSYPPILNGIPPTQKPVVIPTPVFKVNTLPPPQAQFAGPAPPYSAPEVQHAAATPQYQPPASQPITTTANQPSFTQPPVQPNHAPAFDRQ